MKTLFLGIVFLSKVLAACLHISEPAFPKQDGRYLRIFCVLGGREDPVDCRCYTGAHKSGASNSYSQWSRLPEKTSKNQQGYKCTVSKSPCSSPAMFLLLAGSTIPGKQSLQQWNPRARWLLHRGLAWRRAHFQNPCVGPVTSGKDWETNGEQDRNDLALQLTMMKSIAFPKLLWVQLFAFIFANSCSPEKTRARKRSFMVTTAIKTHSF